MLYGDLVSHYMSITEETYEILELGSSFINYSPLKRQPLACYKTLVETEDLTLGHQVTRHTEVAIMSYEFFFQPNHKRGNIH